jgi:glucose-6-phosphate isomerase
MDDASLNFFLGAYENAVHQSLNALQKDRIIDRIWARDYTVWKPAPDEIVNRLGWLSAPADMLKQLSYIHTVVNPVINEGYKNVILLGMGGSSLAAEVFSRIFGRRSGYPAMQILDTADSATIRKIAEDIQLEKTLFIVSSKSGTTLETISLFQYFYNLAVNKLGKRAGRNFIIITDPDSPLEELAYRQSLRHVFLSNPEIGGRYSALSFTGIVPAALSGIDIERLLQNASAAAKIESADHFTGGMDASGCVLGAVLGSLERAGCNKLTFNFPPQWEPFGSWLEQLLAESTGKEGRGILPVCGESLRQPDTYGHDRLFVIFRSKENPASNHEAALAIAGHPVITIRLGDYYDLGGQMFLWEMATAVASHIIGVNPFNQPDVETTKVIVRRMIGLYREKKELPQDTPSFTTTEGSTYGCGMDSPGEALEKFLAQAQDGAYVCFHVYLSPAKELDNALQQLRDAISIKYNLAVTVCYGPRYLHSTGQEHKGDAGHGLFIQLTADDHEDLAIPDRIGASGSTLTFGAMKSAQAIGDRQALIGLRRKVIRFHLGKNITSNISAITNYIVNKRGL